MNLLIRRIGNWPGLQELIRKRIKRPFPSLDICGKIFELPTNY